MLENNYQINFIETYLIDEVKQMIYDDDKLTEYKELAQQLGLKENLTVDNKSPIPFHPMKDIERNVFGELCPKKTPFKEFDETPIPLEILKLIKLGLDEKYFTTVEIWHDYKKPDPVAVGIVGYWYFYDSGYTRIKENGKDVEFTDRNKANEYLKNNPDITISFAETKNYLIGRWADVKASFKELQQRAKERFILDLSVRYEKQLKEAQRNLDDVKLNATERFGI